VRPSVGVLRKILSVKLLMGALVVIGLASIASLEAQRRQAGVEAGQVPRLLILATAAFAVVLLRLPVLGGGKGMQFVTLAPFVLGAAWMLPRGRTRPDQLCLLFLAAYGLVMAIALLRGASHGLYRSKSGAIIDGLSILTVATFAVALMTSAQDVDERRRRLVAVALAPAVYCAVNVLMHLAGFTSNSTSLVIGEQDKLLGLLGQSQTRIVPPLGSAVNSFGAVAGAGLAATLLMWRLTDVSRLLLASGIGFCLYGALLTDSRSAIALGLVMGLIAPALIRTRLAVIVPVLLLVSPAIILGFLGALDTTAIGTLFARRAGDLATASNRSYIWTPVWHFIRHDSVGDLLLGYGQNGQVSSGASAGYAYLFNIPDPTQVSTHNVIFQMVLDTGYLGVAAFTAATMSALGGLQRLARTEPTVIVLAGALLALLAAGGTEALPTFLFPDTIMPIFLGLGVAAGAITWRPEGEQAVSPVGVRRKPAGSSSRLDLRSAPAGS
jgi:hypothetical protein